MSQKKRKAGGGSRPPRKSRSHVRRNAFVVIAAGALGLAGYFLKPVLFPSALPDLAGNVIDLRADMQGFDQKLIRVKAGVPVTVRLTSLDNQFHMDGGGKHQFAVDELGVDIVAPSLGSASATFTPEKPGRYVFYCDICCGGRANPAMNGTIVVEA